VELKERIKKEAEELVLEVRKKTDVGKLKEEICKYYGFEKQPLEVYVGLLIIDIEELKGVFVEMFQKKYRTMEPFEFVRFIQLVEFEERMGYYREYSEGVWKLLRLFDKLVLMECRVVCCRERVSKEEILGAIGEEGGVVGVREFEVLTGVMVKCLSGEEQLEVLRVVERYADGVGGG
jgi:hypothetical protein